MFNNSAVRNQNLVHFRQFFLLCVEYYSVNHLDIAPQFASILMGLSNTVATLPGMFSPLLTGHLVQDKVSVVFLIGLSQLLLHILNADECHALLYGTSYTNVM